MRRKEGAAPGGARDPETGARLAAELGAMGDKAPDTTEHFRLSFTGYRRPRRDGACVIDLSGFHAIERVGVSFRTRAGTGHTRPPA